MFRSAEHDDHGLCGWSAASCQDRKDVKTFLVEAAARQVEDVKAKMVTGETVQQPLIIN